MSKLIDADTVATRIEEMPCYYDECIDTIEAIVEMIKHDIPPVEAIPIELYEQVKGERDAAVEQLKSLNIELFEKPYRKAISIDWIANKWAKKFWKVINDKKYYTGDGYDTVWDMIEDWEKENETN